MYNGDMTFNRNRYYQINNISGEFYTSNQKQILFCHPDIGYNFLIWERKEFGIHTKSTLDIHNVNIAKIDHRDRTIREKTSVVCYNNGQSKSKQMVFVGLLHNLKSIIFK